MNAIGSQQTLKGQAYTIGDPFNYAGHQRNMTMSMNTIDATCDNVKTQVKSFITARVASNNLECVDIPGKYKTVLTLYLGA
jgi:hypothetical protein